jgi:hypothetical protein
MLMQSHFKLSKETFNVAFFKNIQEIFIGLPAFIFSQDKKANLCSKLLRIS